MEIFKQKLDIAINCMLQNDACGEVIAFKREAGNLKANKIDDIGSISSDFDQYEAILFDGGNVHGDAWKYIFFPKTGVFSFTDESEKQKRKFK